MIEVPQNKTKQSKTHQKLVNNNRCWFTAKSQKLSNYDPVHYLDG